MSIFYSLHDFLILEHKTSHFNAMQCNAVQCIALPFPLPGTYDQPLIETSNLKQFWTIWQFLAIFDNFFLLFKKSNISGQPWQFLQHFDESKCISTMARMGAAILVASSPPSLSLYWTLLLCSIGGAGSATWSSASLPLATNSKWSEALLCRIQPIELDCKQPTALQSNDTHGTL